MNHEQLASHKFMQDHKDGIFVFGSNEAGRHGAGAARDALQWGAEYGCGHGLSGRTYAIPTKDANLKTLPLDRIQEYINTFHDFAADNQHLEFYVTKIGCGLAGYSVREIAKLFRYVGGSNITLPDEFEHEIQKRRYWKLKCIECGQTLQSMHQHDFVQCDCDNQSFIDGGRVYCRIGAMNLSKVEVETGWDEDI